MNTPYKKKLIEVALPLDAINIACEADKNIKTGHIRNIHKWFAPMPLPAWRALLFASLVSYIPDQKDTCFSIMRGLVSKNKDEVRQSVMRAKHMIAAEWKGTLPLVLDPFCGGGSTIVEAQRLGLSAIGSDINPVPVMITSILTSFIQRFNNQEIQSANMLAANSRDIILGDFTILANEVERNACAKVGELFPEVALPDGRLATVASAIWARTVRTPNPAYNYMHVPLVKSFWLSKAKNNLAWVSVEKEEGTYYFKVKRSGAPNLRGTMAGGGAKCVMSGEPIPFGYIRSEAIDQKLSLRMLALQCVLDGKKIYVDPDKKYESMAHAEYSGTLTPLPEEALGFRIQGYGIRYFEQLFTNRQLAVLDSFAYAVSDVCTRIDTLIRTTISSDDSRPFAEGGCGTVAYREGQQMLLALAVGKLVQSNNCLVRWYIDARNGAGQPIPAFDKQTLQMSWDFAEPNPFAGSIGSWKNQVNTIKKAFGDVDTDGPPATVRRIDARHAYTMCSSPVIVATDPPYYNNIGYGDLSDTFYIWLRKATRGIYAAEFSTIKTPKEGELIAEPSRHGSISESREYFREGFRNVFRGLSCVQDDRAPFIVMYAFKQQDAGVENLPVSTGWEVTLQALVDASVSIVGTWPISSNRTTRMRAVGSNALASSLALICRYRFQSGQITRGEYIKLLRRELPGAIRILQESNIAPVDLAQASIGPGMAIFTRYAKVLEADDGPMTVKTALQLINQALDEYLSEQESEYDADTRFAITWFETYGMDNGPYGTAETLATARGVAVSGVEASGVLIAKGGKVRLLKREEMPDRWDPATDARFTVWEGTQHLIRRLNSEGERAAAELLVRLGSRGEAARDLAYRLYGICERKKWADEARAYNGLAVAWPELTRLAAQIPSGAAQAELAV